MSILLDAINNLVSANALVLAGSTSGSLTIIAPAIAGSTVLTLPTANGTILAPAAVAVNGSLLIGNTVSGGFDVSTITQGTNITVTNDKGSITVASSDAFAQAQANAAFNKANAASITLSSYTSLSATAVDFSSIPAGTKRITVIIWEASTNGFSPIQVQIGDAGGMELTGYTSRAQTGGTVRSSTTGFLMECNPTAATNIRSGKIVIDLIDAATFKWVSGGTVGNISATNSYYSSGIKALSAELTQIRITTNNGTDTFNGGSVNINYE